MLKLHFNGTKITASYGICVARIKTVGEPCTEQSYMALRNMFDLSGVSYQVGESKFNTRKRNILFYEATTTMVHIHKMGHSEPTIALDRHSSLVDVLKAAGCHSVAA